MQTGNDVKYFISDHLGSTNALTDATGNVTSSASYDSFGNATGNLTTRYQFTGREFDSFTGLHFYRARWYDGNLGRFISEDPIGFAGGDVNLYGYVWNNPQGFVDPSGLQGNGWGNDFADWSDERINYSRKWWKKDSQHWIWNGSVDTFADLASGFCDMFRVGSGLGYALYAEDENGWGRAAYVMMDVGRGAGLFTLFGGPAAGRGLGRGPGNRIQEGPNYPPPTQLRNGHLAGGRHPVTNVPFDETGFPNFSRNLYPDGVNDVTITPTGNRLSDFRAANQAAGYETTPSGYTWHHHQEIGRMQLVEKNIHARTGHTGGFSLW